MTSSVDTTRLLAAYEFVAAMVADRPDGENYLPLFEHLEREVSALDARESAVERARRVARGRVAA